MKSAGNTTVRQALPSYEFLITIQSTMKFSSEAKRPSYAEGILFSLDSCALLSF